MLIQLIASSFDLTELNAIAHLVQQLIISACVISLLITRISSMAPPSTDSLRLAGGVALLANLEEIFGFAVRSIVCAPSGCRVAMGTFALLNTLRTFKSLIKRDGARLICVLFANFVLWVRIVLVLCILMTSVLRMCKHAVQGNDRTCDCVLNTIFPKSL